MNDLKMKRAYQIANLIGAIICSLLFATIPALLLASVASKDALRDCDGSCSDPFGETFLFYFTKILLIGLGGFLLAYTIQFVFSLQYFSRLNGILMVIIGTIFSFFIYVFTGNFYYTQIKGMITIFAVAALIFVLLMALILSPLFIYERIKQRKSGEILQ